MDWEHWWQDVLEDVETWCRNKSPIWRAILLLYFGYAGIHSVFDPEYQNFFSGITFGIHELGHVMFNFAGLFISVLGGSLAQVAAPLIIIGGFLHQRDYFAVTIGSSWLSLSLSNLATYVGDARAQNLPLLGLTDDPIHDWHYLLSALGLLNFDTKLALLIRVLALGIILASIASGAWLCYRMHMLAQKG